MSELKPLEERIKNLTIGLLGMADGETIQVNKSFLEHVRADMVELSKLRRAQLANEPLMLNEPWEMLERLEAECREVGDGDYTNEYMWGHRNGQIELLRQILNTGEGTCESDRRKPEGSENDAE